MAAWGSSPFQGLGPVRPARALPHWTPLPPLQLFLPEISLILACELPQKQQRQAFGPPSSRTRQFPRPGIGAADKTSPENPRASGRRRPCPRGPTNRGVRNSLVVPVGKFAAPDGPHGHNSETRQRKPWTLGTGAGGGFPCVAPDTVRSSPSSQTIGQTLGLTPDTRSGPEPAQGLSIVAPCV